jgi:glyoxylase-like metal-dependent hydrolase (beta-lactamase superfamily II)
MLTRRALLPLLSIASLLGVWVYAQNAKPPGPLRIAQVKPGLHMISGEGGNVAVLATDEGVVLVDDMFDRNHADILTQVKSVTDKPLRYVINTHQHDDHAGGDMKMLPIAEVIAHRNVRANLAHIRQPYYEDTPGTPIGLPRVTFTDEMSVFLGSKDGVRETRAKYFGRGHTSGDAVIYFPELKTIHTGDLFLGTRGSGLGARGSGPAATPARTRPRGVNIYVDYAQGGSFLDWTKTLDGALSLDFDTVIPGHGPVSTKEDVAKFRADLETMRNRLAGMIKEGVGKPALLKTLEDDYGWRSTGCPLTPPTPGCLQFQQIDSLIAELKK